MPLILRGLIRLYRRVFSGRLPGVHCSFTATESCSAYGLRICDEPGAIGRIRRRLARCGAACLLTDGRALSWSALHDRSPDEIAAEMRADAESDASIELILAARHTVAVWRREHAGTAKPVRFVSQPAIRARWERRAFLLAVIGAVAAIVAGFHPIVGGLAFGMIATGSAISVRDATERDERFAMHARWAKRR